VGTQKASFLELVQNLLSKLKKFHPLKSKVMLFKAKIIIFAKETSIALLTSFIKFHYSIFEQCTA